MSKQILKVRIILWLVLTGVVGWLFYMGIVPGGKIVYSYDFSRHSSFIEKLTPTDRIEEIKNGTQKIIGNPVYFSLRTPRRFNKAKLSIKYRDSKGAACFKDGIMSDCVSIIEAGVLMDKTIWNYKLEPVENKIINNIALVWDEIREGDLVLLQNDMMPEEKKYTSIKEFLNNLPSREEIAVYNTELEEEFLLEDYKVNTELSSVPALRGAYQFYLYNTKDINVNFKFSNLNKNDDKDPIDIFLYYSNEVIDSRHLAHADEREINFKAANMPEGLYKIEVKANDDVISELINANTNRLSFINKIWLAKKGMENIIIYTDGHRLHVQTVNPSSLQNVQFGNKKIELNETYKLISSGLNYATSSEIRLEKDGVIVATNGILSFKKESLINPSFKKVTSDLDVKKQGINYILAEYISPKLLENEWKEAVLDFYINSAYREFYKYGFIISIPSLRADDEINDYIEIDEIKIELEGTSLVNYVKNIFK